MAWAKDTVQKGREHFAAKKWCAPTDPKFSNRVEENLATKRQSSAESEGTSGKRPRHKEEAPKASKFKAAAATSEVAKRGTY